MTEGEYEDTSIADDEIELARANETDQYATMMRRYLDVLTMIYEQMMARLISNQGSEQAVNACIAKMLSVLNHLLPKIEGGGTETKELKAEFDKYSHWMQQVQTMKIDRDEMNKIPELYGLIIRAFDVLGLTRI